MTIKKLRFTLFAVLTGGVLAAQNLIVDSDCNLEPDTGELAVMGFSKQGKHSPAKKTAIPV